jgi:two-component system LytT family sensor kinase
MSREKKIPHNFQDTLKGQHPGKDMKLNRKQIYWVSQIAGWMFFVAINLFIIASIEELPWQKILVWIFLGVLGILFTHLLRRVIRKKNWLSLPLKNTIPRVLLASIITGTIIYAFVFAASYIAGTMNQEEFNIARPIAGVINLGGITLLWSLIYFVVHYMENYKKKEIESLIWEAAVKDYELRTLKSQLNPHFMFNAMNSIRALIEEDPESAKVAITKLSNILRYSLQMERMERVPLEDEIETVKNYLDLERIRFEDRLNYKLDVDKASEKIEIPPMMIQTLVENGIKHGVSKQTKGGENSSGFGVSNTKHRLNLLFGENANFSIKNENGETVLAEVEIPIPTRSG